MKAKEFFKPKDVAEKALEAFQNKKKSKIIESENGLCTCEIEPTFYSVNLSAWEAETGLDCEDALEFEAEVEDLYLELLAKSEREQKDEQLHNETLNYTSNFI